MAMAMAMAMAMVVMMLSGELSDLAQRRKLLALFGYELTATIKPVFAIAIPTGCGDWGAILTLTGFSAAFFRAACPTQLLLFTLLWLLAITLAAFVPFVLNYILPGVVLLTAFTRTL